MSQRTTYLYRLVTNPVFYSWFQSALGANRVRTALTRNHYDIKPGARVLDIGCGPADLLNFLPECDYTGVDLNEPHIEHAKAKFGTRGRFLAMDVAELSANATERFDRVLFSGLFHHLDDDVSEQLLKTCSKLLRPGGKIVGHEPVYVPNQNPVAKWIMDHDSGQNIREIEGYQALFNPLDGELSTKIYDDLIWIPYNHLVLEWYPNP